MDTGLNVDDRLAIQELEALYGLALDDCDWDTFDEVFTVDAVIDFTGAGIPLIEGLDAIKLQYSTQLVHPVAHVISGFVIRGVSADEASVRCKLVAPRHDGSVITCDYDDVAVRTPDGWRLSRKTAHSRMHPDTFAENRGPHRD
jgi:hypothetical protein